MASVTLSGVVNEGLLRGFQSVSSGSASKNVANALKGGSSTASLSTTLRVGARTYAAAISGLNSLASYINISKDTMEQLGKLTDKLMQLTKHATDPGVGPDSRAQLDRQFKKLAKDFQKVVDKAVVGEHNYLDREGLAELFTIVGLDRTTADSIAQQFGKFLVTKKDTKLASEYEKGKRPVPIPPSAYQYGKATQSTTYEGTGTFTTAGSYSSSYAAPYAVATADVNSDGYLDLVNTGNPAISVSLGNGNGTFKAQTSYTTTLDSRDVQLQDLNNDGAPDAVVTGIDTSGIQILVGNGDGSFRAGVSYNAAGTVDTSVIIDLDGDSVADIATADRGSGSISVFIGNGNATFKTSVSYAQGGEPRQIRSGDLDGDGDNDLVVGDYLNPSLSVFLNNGNGTFAAQTTLPAVGFSANSLDIGDINQDGNQDVVALTDFAFTVFLGNGNGTFSEYATWAFGAAEQRVELFDSNDDGLLDLGYTSEFNDTFEIALGNGNGSFKTPTSYSAGVDPRALAVGDFDGDTVNDIAVALQGDQANQIFLGAANQVISGPGAFRAPVTFSAPSAGPSLSIDANNDGLLDLFATEVGSTNVSLLLGNGNNTFQASSSISIPSGTVQAFTAVDLDEDGAADLIVSDSSFNQYVFLGNGNGTFQAGAVQGSVGTGPSAIVAADFNEDGIIDTVSANQFSGFVTTALGNGNGTFQSSVNTTASNFYKNIESRDINSDGHLDLIGNTATGPTVLLGNGNGTFKTEASFTGFGASSMGLRVADFNGDGMHDLITTSYADAAVFVGIGNGDGSFAAATSYDVYGTEGRSLTSADYNGDGMLDVARVASNSQAVSILYGNGNGSFKAVQSFNATGNVSSYIVGADFNKDGADDLVVSNIADNTISVFGGYSSIGTLLSQTTPEFEKLFDTDRSIRRRPDAYKMLYDLKSLRKQIDKNIKALDSAVDLVAENAQLVRATGFAFLNLSNQITGKENAVDIAQRLREMILADAPGALAQAENLQSITVAALALQQGGE